VLDYSSDGRRPTRRPLRIGRAPADPDSGSGSAAGRRRRRRPGRRRHGLRHANGLELPADADAAPGRRLRRPGQYRRCRRRRRRRRLRHAGGVAVPAAAGHGVPSGAAVAGEAGRAAARQQEEALLLRPRLLPRAARPLRGVRAAQVAAQGRQEGPPAPRGLTKPSQAMHAAGGGSSDGDKHDRMSGCMPCHHAPCFLSSSSDSSASITRAHQLRRRAIGHLLRVRSTEDKVLGFLTRQRTRRPKAGGPAGQYNRSDQSVSAVIALELLRSISSSCLDLNNRIVNTTSSLAAHDCRLRVSRVYKGHSRSCEIRCLQTHSFLCRSANANNGRRRLNFLMRDLIARALHSIRRVVCIYLPFSFADSGFW
jgi:hypothetical protein